MTTINSKQAMAATRVNVLLATFNGEKWLPAQLESILRQQGVAVSVVVSDDGSTDGTLDQIVAMRTGGLNVRFIDSPLQGGTAGRNFFRLIMAVDDVAFDYVALADQDDIWFEDKLSRGVSMLISSGADGYSAAALAVWPDGRTKLLPQSPHQRPADFLFEGAGQGCTYILRREAFLHLRRLLVENADRLGDIHYHDWTLYALSRMSGQRWIFDPRPSINYRQHEGNDTGARSGLSALRTRLSLIRSGWYGRQITAVANLCSALPVADVDQIASRAVAEFLWLRREAENRRPVTKLNLARWVFINGRRRLSDRIMLGTAALMGYL